MRLSSMCTDLLNGYLIFDFNFYCFQIVDVSEDWQKEDKLARLLDESREQRFWSLWRQRGKQMN